MRNDFRGVASCLPDIPRWVETRGMLLTGRGEILGAASKSSPDFVVRGLNNRLISVVGKPDALCLNQAVAKSGLEVEVLAMPENDGYVGSILQGWCRSPAILHRLAQPIQFQIRKDVTVQFIRQRGLHSLQEDFSDLVGELFDALDFTDIAAVMVENQPVSFCYAGRETETLWDISIDTLPDHRRRGYADHCVSFLIDHMARRGKQPVWGAEESNMASLTLAAKLGFKPVDRVTVLRR